MGNNGTHGTVENKIVAFLAQHGNSTKLNIVQAVPARRQDLLQALRHLLQEGRISRVGLGKPWQPYRYFVRLPAAPPVPSPAPRDTIMPDRRQNTPDTRATPTPPERCHRCGSTMGFFPTADGWWDCVSCRAYQAGT
jgi:hypothetical protein